MGFERMEDAKWKKYKEKIKKRWETLQDSDIDPFRGSFDNLTHAIQQKCVEPRTVVQQFIDGTWFQIYLR